MICLKKDVRLEDPSSQGKVLQIANGKRVSWRKRWTQSLKVIPDSFPGSFAMIWP
jgi:hypothetical protein